MTYHRECKQNWQKECVIEILELQALTN